MQTIIKGYASLSHLRKYLTTLSFVFKFSVACSRFYTEDAGVFFPSPLPVTKRTTRNQIKTNQLCYRGNKLPFPPPDLAPVSSLVLFPFCHHQLSLLLFFFSFVFVLCEHILPFPLPRHFWFSISVTRSGFSLSHRFSFSPDLAFPCLTSSRFPLIWLFPVSPVLVFP